jgi:hypothetical protein
MLVRRAGAAQARHCRAIDGGGLLLREHGRAGGGDLATHVEEILHADGHSGQRRHRCAGRAQRIDRARSGHRRVERDAQEGMPACGRFGGRDGLLEQVGRKGSGEAAARIWRHGRAILEWFS